MLDGFNGTESRLKLASSLIQKISAAVNKHFTSLSLSLCEAASLFRDRRAVQGGATQLTANHSSRNGAFMVTHKMQVIFTDGRKI